MEIHYIGKHGSFKKAFIHALSKNVSLQMTWQTNDDLKLVTVSNTEYEQEMITGSHDIACVQLVNIDYKPAYNPYNCYI